MSRWMIFIVTFFCVGAIVGIVVGIILSKKSGISTYSCNYQTGKCTKDENGEFTSLKDCKEKCKSKQKSREQSREQSSQEFSEEPTVLSDEYYEGNGEASYTHYTPGESPGIGSCGGCVWPKTGIPQPDGEGSYDGLFKHIQKEVGKNWSLAATSEAMMAPYCPASVGMGCKGRKDPTGPTANAPCGSCWNLKNKENNKSVNVYVADACPCGNKKVCPDAKMEPQEPADNSKWCVAKPGKTNSVGEYNHFDVWNGPQLGFDGAGSITFTNIECPSKLKEIMKTACCNTYWEGQGCPNICGNDFKCPPG